MTLESLFVVILKSGFKYYLSFLAWTIKLTNFIALGFDSFTIMNKL